MENNLGDTRLKSLRKIAIILISIFLKLIYLHIQRNDVICVKKITEILSNILCNEL